MPMRRLKELNTRDCLWVYILRILLDGQTHAYTIRKEIEKRFGFKPGTMTAYKVLYLLNRSGFVTKTEIGRKRIYEITPDGRKELGKAVGFYSDLAKNLKK
jgi:DNA-binding PadR family transcriptional regulator